MPKEKGREVKLEKAQGFSSTEPITSSLKSAYKIEDRLDPEAQLL